MADAPIQLIVAAFSSESGADQALKALKEAKKEHLIKIDNAAVLRKGDDGKLKLSETGDMTGTRGAVYGGVIGAVVGVIAGPVGWVAVGGATIGGLVAKLRDSGFKDDRLKKLGEGLTPNSSAIVAVIEHTWVTDLEKALQELGADVVTEAVSDDIAAQLQAAKDSG
jgi:uncharacterized membrane protein